MPDVGRRVRDHMRIAWVIAVLAVLISGCGPESPKDGGGASPPATGDKQESDVDNASLENVTLQQVTEVFILGSDSTDVQRDNLRARIVGKIVQWEVPVYDVTRNGGNYKIVGAGTNLLPT